MRKWREKERERARERVREGDWHTAGEREKGVCVSDRAEGGGGVVVRVVGWAG